MTVGIQIVSRSADVPGECVVDGPVARHAEALAPWYLNQGYAVARQAGKFVKMHRLAWVIMNGPPVPPIIDHINRNKLDNRIENLRPASARLNTLNRTLPNSTGARGVRFFSRSTRRPYMARIKGLDGRRRHLGSFATIEEASAAYEAALKAEIAKEVR
jgi:hypothetical protein